MSLRIVRKAVAIVLTAICEQDFPDCSYGFRPDKGAKDAVCDPVFQLQFGVFGYIVEADTKAYFDNIDHNKLLTMLEKRVNTRAFMRLNTKWLKSAVILMLRPFDFSTERPYSQFGLNPAVDNLISPY
jgi:RNA-directed DNA polymerase